MDPRPVLPEPDNAGGGRYECILPLRQGSFFMRAVIFANGEINHMPSAAQLVRGDDRIISVDGGMRHVQALGLKSYLIIGDMDSILPDLLLSAQQDGIEILRFPSEKDETDLELAIQLVQQRGFTECLVIGALGGRIDQTLANIWLLLSGQQADFKMVFDDGCERLSMVTDALTIIGTPGDIISLIPFGSPVSGITTAGLAYPLVDETLYPEKTRGLSNVMTAEEVEIRVGSGRLLCVQRRVAACKKEKK